MKIAAYYIIALLLAVGLLLIVSDYLWRTRTAAIVRRLRPEPAAAAARPVAYTAADLDQLPPPVARYFRAVLREGQPLVRSARVKHRGQFLLSPAPDGWRPFVSTEHFAARPAGFVWDARISMIPGLNVFVRDAFLAGQGSMIASPGGVWRIVSVEGTPEIAAGALDRYLAEAVWLPTALLPREGVVWTPLDDESARATLTAAGTTVSLDFHFGRDHLVRRVFTPSRSRDVNGRGVPTPWQGRFTRYEERDGMLIPMAGEVEWLLPEGPQPYWRGEITEIEFAY